MNTSKQVNVMVGLLFVGLVGTLLYFLWDSTRAEEAALRQELVNVERGAALYSLNCRSCHGLYGEGALERGGLPGAPLNVEANRPPELEGGLLEARRDRFHATIVCGRVGTVMPPWSIEWNGPLNDFQISQLVLLITSEHAEEGWEFAVEEANHTDEFDVRKFLTAPVSADDDEIQVSNVAGIELPEEGQYLIRLGGEELGAPYEILEVTEIREDENILVVERGTDIAGTAAMDHAQGEEVFEGPVAPGTTITGDPEAQGDPPCGQSAARPADDGGGGDAEQVELTGVEEVEMGNNFFQVENTRNPTFLLPVGETADFQLTNIGNAPHNMRTTGPDGEYDTDDDMVSEPDVVPGGGNATMEITYEEAGTYPYRCDFHPVDMTGEIIVE